MITKKNADQFIDNAPDSAAYVKPTMQVTFHVERALIKKVDAKAKKMRQSRTQYIASTLEMRIKNE